MSKLVEQLLFNLGKPEPKQARRVRHYQIMQRRFSVTIGSLHIEIKETESSASYYSGSKLKDFLLLTAEVERHERGMDYALREAIIGRLK